MLTHFDVALTEWTRVEILFETWFSKIVRGTVLVEFFNEYLLWTAQFWAVLNVWRLQEVLECTRYRSDLSLHVLEVLRNYVPYVFVCIPLCVLEICTNTLLKNDWYFSFKLLFECWICILNLFTKVP